MFIQAYGSACLDMVCRILWVTMVCSPLEQPFNKTFVIETDACDVGIGAVLIQDGHPLAFVSKALGPRNKTLSVYEEYLAILLAIEQWRPYLHAQEFIIKSDQKSLAHLNDQRLHTEWQRKALTKMMGLTYKVVYKKGSTNSAADALSRRPPVGDHILAISSASPTWLEDVVKSYLDDPKAQSLLTQLALHPDSVPNFKLQNGVLKFKNCIWLGNWPELHARIFQAFH